MKSILLGESGDEQVLNASVPSGSCAESGVTCLLFTLVRQRLSLEQDISIDVQVSWQALSNQVVSRRSLQMEATLTFTGEGRLHEAHFLFS